MINVLTLLKTELQQDAGVVGVVGNGCYAIAAPQDSGKKFMAYTASEEPSLTKDGGEEFTVRITASALDVDDLLLVMAAAKDAMVKNTIRADYQGSSEIEQSADQHFIITLNYTLTII